jgi:tetratricopeptide (TPR) repeat protein
MKSGMGKDSSVSLVGDVGTAGNPTSFKYVFIPAELSAPMEERDMEMVPGKEVECLTDTLKAHFQRVASPAAGGASMVEVIRAQIAEKHGAEAAAKIDPQLLASFANQQMVDITAVQPGTKQNGFTGVSFYVDDQGMAKQLPQNVRASQLAQACGYALSVSGDCFVARVFDDENDFRRIDFTMAELSSEAAWVQVARAYHAAHPAAQPGAETMRQGGMGGASPAPAPAPPSAEERAETQKARGNAAFKKRRYKQAIGSYGEAIRLQPANHVLWANRAAAHGCVGDWEASALDAQACVEREPGFVKGWFRLAKARTQLKQLPAAHEAIQTGLRTAEEGAAAAAAEGAAAVGGPLEEMRALLAEIEAGLGQAERLDGLAGADSDGGSGKGTG